MTFMKNKIIIVAVMLILLVSGVIYTLNNQNEFIDEFPPSSFSVELSQRDTEMINAVKEIESFVITLIGEDDLSKVNQATMALIRKDRYGENIQGISRFIWSRFAGALESETGLTYKDNPELVGLVDQKLPKLISFESPISGANIDFIHMITVIDLDQTISSKVEYEDEYYDYLFSWGGDLETFLIDIAKDANKRKQSDVEDYRIYAELKLGSKDKTYFSEEDLLADIDGLNISKTMWKENILLSDAIINYYQYGGFMTRYTQFINTFGDTEIFKEKVTAFIQSDVENQYVNNPTFETFHESYIGLKQLMSMYVNKSEIEVTLPMREIAGEVFVNKILDLQAEEVMFTNP